MRNQVQLITDGEIIRVVRNVPWRRVEMATRRGRTARSRRRYMRYVISQIVNAEMFRFAAGQISADTVFKRVIQQFECYRTSIEKERGAKP